MVIVSSQENLPYTLSTLKQLANNNNDLYAHTLTHLRTHIKKKEQQTAALTELWSTWQGQGGCSLCAS